LSGLLWFSVGLDLDAALRTLYEIARDGDRAERIARAERAVVEEAVFGIDGVRAVAV